MSEFHLNGLFTLILPVASILMAACESNVHRAGVDSLVGNHLSSNSELVVTVSPDEQSVAVKKRRHEGFELIVRNLKAGTDKIIDTGKYSQFALSWSGDSRFLSYFQGPYRKFNPVAADLVNDNLRAIGKPSRVAIWPVQWSPVCCGFAYLRVGERATVLNVQSYENDQEQVLVSSKAHSSSNVKWSSDGRLLAFISNENPGSIAITSRNEDENIVVPVFKKGSITSLAWSPDGAHIAALGEQESDDFARLFVVDVRARKLVRTIPISGRDVASFDWQAPNLLTLSADYAGSSTLYLANLDGRTSAMPVLPSGVYAILGRSQSSEAMLVRVEGISEPASIWKVQLLDYDKFRAEPLYRPVLQEQVIMPQLIQIKKSKGVIHGFLWKPAKDDATSSIIISIHGGPNIHELPVWNPRTQGYVKRGFHYLALNYSGSSGYGLRYGRMGTTESRAKEVAAAIEWANRELGIPNSRIVLLSGSYGTKLAVQSLCSVKEPLGAVFLLTPTVEKLRTKPTCPRRLYVYMGADNDGMPPADCRKQLESHFGKSVFDKGHGEFRVIEEEGHSFHKLSSHAEIDSAIIHSLGNRPNG